MVADAKYISDFLLADMILCLELFYMKSGVGSADCEIVIGENQALEMLWKSRNLWHNSYQENAEAKRASKIIARMLSFLDKQPC